jgi:hypothetical protein
MERRGWSTLLGVMALSACEPYRGPCDVRDQHTVLVQGFTPDLQVSGDGEIWATGWQLEDEEDDDTSTQLAGVARFTPAGELLESWAIPVPVLPTDVLGPTASLEWAWSGDRIAAVRKITEVLPPDEDGEHLRSVLSMRAVATDGTAGPPVELWPTSCVDCQLDWAIRSLAGQIAVVHRPLSLTGDAQEPLEMGFTYYLLLDATGEVTAHGRLPLAPTTDKLGRFEVDARGLGFWLSTPEGQVLLDRELQLVGGPYATESTGPTPMDVDGSVVHAAWVDEADNVFQRSYGIGGSPLAPMERLSHGTAQAVRASDRGLGVVLRDDGRAFFALSVNNEKVGGDTLLPDIIGGWTAIGALFVDGTADFTLFMGDLNQVDRLELHCAP